MRRLNALLLFCTLLISVSTHSHARHPDWGPYLEQNMQIVSTDPDVRIYRHFITNEEAQHLINIGAGLLQRSTVTDEDGRSSMVHEGRTSSTAFLLHVDDPVIRSIEARVSDLLDVPLDHIEPLQIVHYNKGQEYRPHYDYFPPEHVELYEGAQREHTLLIYLNTLPPEAGGETIFPNLQLGVKPVAGSALYFRDMKPDGTPDTNTLHGGGPVYEEGYAKWACNVWIRNLPVNLEEF